jgi:glycyl-tRNA synthetase beta chain
MSEESPATRPAKVARRDLLVELGTEELPPKALHTLELALLEGLQSRLRQAGLSAHRVESFATPRRLAVLLTQLPVRQPDQLIRRRGPPISVAFDQAGEPTRAASAFAQSCSVALSALGRERDARGIEYLSFEGIRPGAELQSLLPRLLQEALDALPVPKRMRWGALEVQFVRPVHWLVLLLGKEVVPAELFGARAGNVTFGHRFMAPGALRLTSPASYAKTLLTRGKVMAPFEARRAHIRVEVESLAERLGGQVVLDEALLDEVTALVEWPVALDGAFEPRFLVLPREVLLATLQAHQRCFAMQDRSGALLPRFITVSNIESPDPNVIRAGNERVVRPRLTDAAFFWDQDRRHPLRSHRAGLDNVSYQAALGSIGARVERIAALARSIGARVEAAREHIDRAAELAKCDLLTLMVGEFPELQGITGRHYALADGEPPVVADAIAEHYLPKGAGDALPSSRVGDALALADKLDSLAGIFAIGQKPTGTRDPFGLRRAAIGIVRIVLEHRLELDLIALLDQAVRAQPLPDIAARAEDIGSEIYDYILERLRAQYLEHAAQNGISTELFDAVLATRPASLLDFDGRVRALIDFLARPEGASLASANKRIANILRKSDATQASGALDAALLQLPAERALSEALQALSTAVVADTETRAYGRALDRLASLRPAVDRFFDEVLVNDPDQALRRNRMALLSQLRALFAGIAELSCLPG